MSAILQKKKKHVHFPKNCSTVYLLPNNVHLKESRINTYLRDKLHFNMRIRNMENIVGPILVGHLKRYEEWLVKRDSSSREECSTRETVSLRTPIYS